MVVTEKRALRGEGRKEVAFGDECEPELDRFSCSPKMHFDSKNERANNLQTENTRIDSRFSISTFDFETIIVL